MEIVTIISESIERQMVEAIIKTEDGDKQTKHLGDQGDHYKTDDGTKIEK